MIIVQSEKALFAIHVMSVLFNRTVLLVNWTRNQCVMMIPVVANSRQI